MFFTFKIMTEEDNSFECSLYSNWDNINKSWINVPVNSGDSLVVSLHTDGGNEEVHNMKYALLVILLNQDILQRIRFVISDHE